MSHIHSIGGNLNAAAEYQQYLARLAASRRTLRGAESGTKRGVRTFDSAIDPDADPDRDSGGSPDHEPEGEPHTDAEGESGWAVKV